MSDSENVSPIRMFHHNDLSLSSTPIAQTKIANNNSSTHMPELLDSQLKGSPIKRLGLFETTPNSPSSNLTPGSAVPSLAEYKKLERLYADSVIRTRSLTREQERLEDEIAYKDKQIIQKTSRINNLSNENKLIMKDLQNERALNELEFTKFKDIQGQYEAEIKQLRQSPMIQKSQGSDDGRLTQSQIDNIEKLTKRVRILETENELEINSKMLIIDELEFFKSKLSEMESKYESVKNEYESLMEAQFMADDYEEEILEISEEYDLEDQHRLVSSDSHHSDLSDAMSTPSKTYKESAIKSLANELQDMTGIQVAKRQHSSGSNTTIGSNKLGHRRNNSSIRQSSFNKYLKDLEIKNIQQLHSQETMKLNFQLKSLKLQNEKLTSYIGFLLQKQNKSDNRFDIYKDDLDHKRDDLAAAEEKEMEYEYSDEVNIKLAKNNLKTVIRCASAYPIRKTNKPMEYNENQEHENVHESYDDVFKIDENRGKTTITSTRSTSRVVSFDHQNHKMNRRYSSYGNHEQRGEGSNLLSDPFVRSGVTEEPAFELEDSIEDDEEESDYAELGDSSGTNSESDADVDDTFNADHDYWSNEYLNRSMNVSVTPMLSVRKRKKSKSILNQKHVPRRRVTKLTVFNSPLRTNKKPSILFHKIDEEDEFSNNYRGLDLGEQSDIFFDNLDIGNYYDSTAHTRCMKHRYGPCFCHFNNFPNFMNYNMRFIFPGDFILENIYSSHSSTSRVSSDSNGGIERVTSTSSTSNINYTYIYEKYDLKNVKGRRNISDITNEDAEYDSEVVANEID